MDPLPHPVPEYPRQRRITMEQINVNTVANIVTAVCAVLITIKIF